MSFGEQYLERNSGTSRHGRSKASARDASIDEILRSIQQIIDEDPLTMRGKTHDAPEQSSRSRVARSVHENAPHQPQRKRPARNLQAAVADDDVLAELLAPAPEPTAEIAPQLVEVAAATSHADAPVAPSAPTDAATPSVEVLAEPKTATIVDTAEPTPDTLEIPVSDVVDAAADEQPAAATEPVAAAATETAPVEPTQATADALLQSLAAGLAAGGFAEPGPTVNEQTPVASAAVAAVVAANAAPTAMMPSEATALTPAATDGAADTAIAPRAQVQGNLAASEPIIGAAPADTYGLPPAIAHGLDDAIATMLRPLLREWLDAHLPRMVEKALQEELRERPLIASSGAPVAAS